MNHYASAAAATGNLETAPAEYFADDATPPAALSISPRAGVDAISSTAHLHPDLRPSPFGTAGSSNALRPATMDSDADLKTPVSPVSPQHDDLNDPQASRKRSHSVMSQQIDVSGANMNHSRSGSLGSAVDISQADEFASPRGSRTVKRDNAPMNADGKYWCNWSEQEPCHGQTFVRKCEWSKHMDKHDRPYRCHYKQCEKLQGFTYSGGLLRHQREVHGQHGGPRDTLMCPFTSCRRHSGKGFTRKENLNEHLRRVHHIVDPQTQATQYSAVDASLGLDQMHPPGGHMAENIDVNGSGLAVPSSKRKRPEAAMHEYASADTPEALYEEIKRLREESDLKDERIRQMEMERMQQEERLRELQTALEHSQMEGSHVVLDGHHEDVMV